MKRRLIKNKKLGFVVREAAPEDPDPEFIEPEDLPDAPRQTHRAGEKYIDPDKKDPGTPMGKARRDIPAGRGLPAVKKGDPILYPGPGPERREMAAQMKAQQERRPQDIAKEFDSQSVIDDANMIHGQTKLRTNHLAHLNKLLDWEGAEDDTRAAEAKGAVMRAITRHSEALANPKNEKQESLSDEIVSKLKIAAASADDPDLEGMDQIEADELSAKATKALELISGDLISVDDSEMDDFEDILPGLERGENETDEEWIARLNERYRPPEVDEDTWQEFDDLFMGKVDPETGALDTLTRQDITSIEKANEMSTIRASGDGDPEREAAAGMKTSLKPYKTFMNNVMAIKQVDDYDKRRELFNKYATGFVAYMNRYSVTNIEDIKTVRDHERAWNSVARKILTMGGDPRHINLLEEENRLDAFSRDLINIVSFYSQESDDKNLSAIWDEEGILQRVEYYEEKAAPLRQAHKAAEKQRRSWDTQAERTKEELRGVGKEDQKARKAAKAKKERAEKFQETWTEKAEEAKSNLDIVQKHIDFYSGAAQRFTELKDRQRNQQESFASSLVGISSRPEEYQQLMTEVQALKNSEERIKRQGGRAWSVLQAAEKNFQGVPPLSDSMLNTLGHRTGSFAARKDLEDQLLAISETGQLWNPEDPDSEEQRTKLVDQIQSLEKYSELLALHAELLDGVSKLIPQELGLDVEDLQREPVKFLQALASFKEAADQSAAAGDPQAEERSAQADRLEQASTQLANVRTQVAEKADIMGHIDVEWMGSGLDKDDDELKGHGGGIERLVGILRHILENDGQVPPEVRTDMANQHGRLKERLEGEVESLKRIAAIRVRMENSKSDLEVFNRSLQELHQEIKKLGIVRKYKAHDELLRLLEQSEPKYNEDSFHQAVEHWKSLAGASKDRKRLRNVMALQKELGSHEPGSDSWKNIYSQIQETIDQSGLGDEIIPSEEDEEDSEFMDVPEGMTADELDDYEEENAPTSINKALGKAKGDFDPASFSKAMKEWDRLKLSHDVTSGKGEVGEFLNTYMAQFNKPMSYQIIPLGAGYVAIIDIRIKKLKDLYHYLEQIRTGKDDPADKESEDLPSGIKEQTAAAKAKEEFRKKAIKSGEIDPNDPEENRIDSADLFNALGSHKYKVVGSAARRADTWQKYGTFQKLVEAQEKVRKKVGDLLDQLYGIGQWHKALKDPELHLPPGLFHATGPIRPEDLTDRGASQGVRVETAPEDKLVGLNTMQQLHRKSEGKALKAEARRAEAEEEIAILRNATPNRLKQSGVHLGWDSNIPYEKLAFMYQDTDSPFYYKTVRNQLAKLSLQGSGGSVDERNLHRRLRKLEGRAKHARKMSKIARSKEKAWRKQLLFLGALADERPDLSPEYLKRRRVEIERKITEYNSERRAFNVKVRDVREEIKQYNSASWQDLNTRDRSKTKSKSGGLLAPDEVHLAYGFVEYVTNTIKKLEGRITAANNSLIGANQKSTIDAKKKAMLKNAINYLLGGRDSSGEEIPLHTVTEYGPDQNKTVMFNPVVEMYGLRPYAGKGEYMPHIPHRYMSEEEIDNRTMYSALDACIDQLATIVSDVVLYLMGHGKLMVRGHGFATERGWAFLLAGVVQPSAGKAGPGKATALQRIGRDHLYSVQLETEARALWREGDVDNIEILSKLLNAHRLSRPKGFEDANLQSFHLAEHLDNFVADEEGEEAEVDQEGIRQLAGDVSYSTIKGVISSYDRVLKNANEAKEAAAARIEEALEESGETLEGDELEDAIEEEWKKDGYGSAIRSLNFYSRLNDGFSEDEAKEMADRADGPNNPSVIQRRLEQAGTMEEEHLRRVTFAKEAIRRAVAGAGSVSPRLLRKIYTSGTGVLKSVLDDFKDEQSAGASIGERREKISHAIAMNDTRASRMDGNVEMITPNMEAAQEAGDEALIKHYASYIEAWEDHAVELRNEIAELQVQDRELAKKGEDLPGKELNIDGIKHTLNWHRAKMHDARKMDERRRAEEGRLTKLYQNAKMAQERVDAEDLQIMMTGGEEGWLDVGLLAQELGLKGSQAKRISQLVNGARKRTAAGIKKLGKPAAILASGMEEAQKIAVGQRYALNQKIRELLEDWIEAKKIPSELPSRHRTDKTDSTLGRFDQRAKEFNSPDMRGVGAGKVRAADKASSSALVLARELYSSIGSQPTTIDEIEGILQSGLQDSRKNLALSRRLLQSSEEELKEAITQNKERERFTKFTMDTLTRLAAHEELNQKEGVEVPLFDESGRVNMDITDWVRNWDWKDVQRRISVSGTFQESMSEKELEEYRQKRAEAAARETEEQQAKWNKAKAWQPSDEPIRGERGTAGMGHSKRDDQLAREVSVPLGSVGHAELIGNKWEALTGVRVVEIDEYGDKEESEEVTAELTGMMGGRRKIRIRASGQADPDADYRVVGLAGKRTISLDKEVAIKITPPLPAETIGKGDLVVIEGVDDAPYINGLKGHIRTVDSKRKLVVVDLFKNAVVEDKSVILQFKEVYPYYIQEGSRRFSTAPTVSITNLIQEIFGRKRILEKAEWNLIPLSLRDGLSICLTEAITSDNWEAAERATNRFIQDVVVSESVSDKITNKLKVAWGKKYSPKIWRMEIDKSRKSRGLATHREKLAANGGSSTTRSIADQWMKGRSGMSENQMDKILDTMRDD